MSTAPLSPKQAKQDCLNSKLTDAELCEIFKRLPPYERLLASEGCRLWREISRKAWLDVTVLDLSPIPGAHIRSIIKQCPNLQNVFALGKRFDLDELSRLSSATHLSCVTLYNCTFVVRYDPRMDFYDYIPEIFSKNLQHASLNELVLHDELIDPLEPAEWCACHSCSAEYLPASLSRLQLSGWRQDRFVSNLERFQNLECLILLQSLVMTADLLDHPSCLTVNITALQNLREVCIGRVQLSVFKLLVSHLPQLKVLFANEISIVRGDGAVDHLTDVVTKPYALRILVLSGTVRGYPRPAMEIPARKRFPNGFGSDPLPLLNIFVSNDVSRWIHFTPSDAAAIYPINAPMPELLERSDIAPIFEGVWVSEKIKEAAKYGVELLRE